MTDQKDSTEKKILDAAHSVFLRKGLDGSRMQEIATQAGINKALLHYYFRTKQKLFEAIFREIISHAFPDIKNLLFSDASIDIKIETFIERYTEMLLKNPFMPSFILKEIHRDPDMLANIIRSEGINPSEVARMLASEMDAGNIRRMDPRDLMTNLISLVIFPVAAQPLLSAMMFGGDKKAYREFLVSRKKSVKEFVLNSIFIR